MSKIQQDSFTDDGEESCPLCVEEFDLSDKNFKPCPCGYQICQFCYNNIKNNMNGLCPACRRRYDDQSIEWKIVSPEEQKADIALQARKKALARKKETEQRQVETNNRKHLAGLRVVQKNLVYVVGLSQQSSEEEFLKTLRGDQYFGQYGKIIKIVVSKAKAGSSSDNNSIGVYVTFEKREDAARCIAAVDGSRNLEKPLRAQYGTTKYCSAYLRHETCGNRNCTFLHEIGQDYDSFSRQDLSSMNAMSTQRPAGQAQASSSNPPPPHSQPPAQQAPQTISAALQQAARDDAGSRSDNDGPALPSSANWAAKTTQSEAARSSKAASVATPSPVVISSNLATQPAEPSPISKSAEPESQSQPEPEPAETSPPPEPPTRPPAPAEEDLRTTLTRKLIAQKDVFANWKFNTSLYTEQQLKEIYAFPNLIDDQGGLKRYLAEKEQERERLKQEEERNVLGAMSTAEEDENRGSGSLQLGGEPDIEETISEQMGRLRGQNRSTPQATVASPSNQFSFAGSAFQPSNIGNLSRTLTPQQREQLSLLQRSGSTRQSPISQTPFQQGYGQTSSLHQHQTSNPFQNQLQAPGGFGSAQGHARQASRYTFSSDSAMNPAAVKPAANPQLAAQQAGALPATHNKQFQGQQFPQASAPNFYSGVQGPPPGLKSSGTPPINGSGMFGQGHGFASAMGGAGFGGNMGNKNNHDDAMQQLLRSRERGGNGQGAADFGKRELKFPFSSQQPMNPEGPSSSLLNTFYGSQLGSNPGFQDQNLQKQKKKGKKHRHANTSSSGGGGIVDDPSILQARMHHGASSAVPRFAGTASRIDSLVRDAANIGPSASSSSKHVPKVSSTASTPAPAAPGLSSVQEFPSLPTPQKQPAAALAPVAAPKKTAKPTAASLRPVIPKKMPSSISKPVAVQSDILAEQEGKADQSSEAPKTTETSSAMPREDSVKAQANHEEAKSKDGEALGEEEPHRPLTPPPLEKRQRPKSIDIAGATRAEPKEPELSSSFRQESKGKEVDSASQSTPSQPATPATASSQRAAASPAPRPKQPKTIRVSQTPTKGEAASAASPASPASVPPGGGGKAVSRRPSLTSISQPPATPSDNASFTTASRSRANSPPPSLVGAAPVRQMSKAQQKKERQARAKQAEEAIKAERAEKAERMTPTKVEETSVVQEPIQVRKKKTKKEKKGMTAESTPAPTRPSSPTPDYKTENVPPVPTAPPKQDKKAVVVGSKQSPARSEFRSEDAAAVSTSAPIGTNTNTPQENLEDTTRQQSKPASGATMTAHSIYTNLLATSAISPSTADLFKPVSSSTPSSSNDASSDNTNLLSTPLPTLTDSQLRHLEAGHAVLLVTQNNRPVVCLPDRRPLLGLSHQQATRFVELFDTVGGVLPPFSQDNPSDIEKLLPGYKDRLVPATTTAAAATGARADHPAEFDDDDDVDDDDDDEEGQANGDADADGGEMINTFAISEAAAAAAAAAAVNASTALPPALPTSSSSLSPSSQDPAAPAAAAAAATPLVRTGPRVVGFGDPKNLKTAGWGKEARVKVEECEGRWAARKRECEAVEKRLNALIKKNRRLVLGGGGGGGGAVGS